MTEMIVPDAVREAEVVAWLESVQSRFDTSSDYDWMVEQEWMIARMLLAGEGRNAVEAASLVPSPSEQLRGIAGGMVRAYDWLEDHYL